jgi:hypothetical protein
MPPIDRAAAAAAAAAAARQRALEEERRREEAALQAAQERARAEAAREKAAQSRAKAFAKDGISTGRGGALRRGAVARLDARGLDVARPSAPTSASYRINPLIGPPAPVAATKADPTSDAARLGTIQDPGQRAQALQHMVEQNKDPAYRKTLLAAAKPAIEDLSRRVTDKHSGASVASRQAAVDALSHTTEALAPDDQKTLTDTFAGAMKDGNVGDDADEFGTLLKQGVKDGAGAAFGVRLASSLCTEGKKTAANDSAKFVSQGIDDVRKSFDDAKKHVDELHGQLGQELASWQLNGTDQVNALKAFDAEHHLTDATNELEHQGQLLASTLNGAGIAASDPALQAQAAEHQFAGRAGAVTRYGNVGDLLGHSADVLKDIPALASTRAGANAISDAVKQNGEGHDTFLNHVADIAGTGETAKGLIDSVRSAVVQSLGTHLLELARDGNFDSEKNALLKGLNSGRALFGLSEKQMTGLTDALGTFKSGMTDDELKTATKLAGDKISELGDIGGKVGEALKGLTVVFGAIGVVKDWSNFSDADVKEKLGTICNTLSVGKDGADLITGTLSRFAANSAADVAEKAGTDAAAAAETVGLTAGKLLGAGIGALGAVVSGWQAFDDFKAGNTQKGVGETMTAIGGVVATAGLFLDGSIAGAPAGVVLNVVGGVLAAAGTVVSLFAGSPNPFEGDQKDMGKILQQLGVHQDVADKLAQFNSDGQNFGTWVHAVAQNLGQSTGDFVRSMNGWSPKQVDDFLDAARLQRDTDSNNSNRRNNAAAVLGQDNAQKLEDTVHIGYRGGSSVTHGDAQKQLRQQVDAQTGQVTYNAALVQAAADWVRNGKQTG